METLNNDIEKRLHFGADLLEKNRLPFFYDRIYDAETDQELFQTKENITSFSPKAVFQIDDVPGYLNTSLRIDIAKLRKKEVKTYEGSLINLAKFKNLEDYMAKVVSAKRRATLRRCENRLKLCIKPTYKMYFGLIDKNEYEKIFDSCHEMLLRRHQQKKTYWEELEFWQERHDSLYQLIVQKRACIFVIYHGKKPIAIYVNSIYKHILDIDVIAYDIDYSKFKLGFISLIRVIQWAFENKLRLVDMSKGDFYYKERFRTGTYIFKKQLLYNSDNLIISFKAHLTLLKLKLTYVLLPVFKKLKINKLHQKYVRNKKESLFENIDAHNTKFKIEKSKKVSSSQSLTEINVDDREYDFLKEQFYDFLFLNFEVSENVSVYRSNKNEFDYYFVGKETTQKLTVLES
ncbi:GNAT family N-acetyltransferase [Allomuricauda sp. SCSIO 65647]|uniref:GNAT family N-acetyltransferase n=1 Tax=Allomuricauda sp. SCSIO 65647 TaxID=2908843 RepID=UPI001F2CF218|nr:GNAT family N-acetyltransferase [Muricauda sp. SCSIO 65647]UJH67003.1 GNAT family N-acetyltransferase [Muricauda sp. SCSIO 65647]